jgi:hypothetical protein
LLHHRRYTPASLVALLRGAGLSVGVPKYFNVVGLIGWTVNGLILRRGKLSAAQMAIFERLVPLWRLEDKIRLPVGLGLWVVARSPGP